MTDNLIQALLTAIEKFGGSQETTTKLAKLIDLDGVDIEGQIRALPKSVAAEAGLTVLARRPDPSTEFSTNVSFKEYLEAREAGLMPVETDEHGFVLGG